MSRKLRTFGCAADIGAYLFDKNKAKLRKLANRLYSLNKQYRRMGYTYDSLMHIGATLMDVGSILLDPHEGGFIEPEAGTNNSCSSTFFLTIGLARQTTRLVIMLYQTTYGSMCAERNSNFMTAFRMECCNIGRDDKRKEFDTEFNNLMEFVGVSLHSKDSKKLLLLSSPRWERYGMSHRDATQILREATNFDID